MVAKFVHEIILGKKMAYRLLIGNQNSYASNCCALIFALFSANVKQKSNQFFFTFSTDRRFTQSKISETLEKVELKWAIMC